MANDGKGAKGAGVKGSGAAVASVEAGTTRATFRVVAANGSFRDFEATPLFRAGGEIRLGTEEGVITFADVNHKDQAGRRDKLLNPKDLDVAGLAKEPSRLHPAILFFSDSAQKYGGVVACPGPAVGTACPTGAYSRKWTSDMHQSERCHGCGTKAKRAKAKRSGGKGGVPGALVAEPAPVETPAS